MTREHFEQDQKGFRDAAQAAAAEPQSPVEEGVPAQGEIGWAVKQLQNGARVRRAGWNGKGMHLGLQRPDENSKMTLPYVYMSTVQGDLVPWLCSQTDLLAIDWEKVPEGE